MHSAHGDDYSDSCADCGRDSGIDQDVGDSFPNPGFNRISLACSQAGITCIGIYNPAGERVARLREWLEPGGIMNWLCLDARQGFTWPGSKSKGRNGKL